MQGMVMELRKTAVSLLIGTLFISVVHAQPKSIGTSYSFGGAGIVYEHTLSHDSFAGLSLKAETAEMFMGRTGHPGISASFTWNLILKEWTSSDGNRLNLFAGPGLALGWAKDIRKGDGAVIGLTGRLGMECSFKRKVLISISISPIIGTHAEFLDDSIRMTHYLNGLASSSLPEIGIRYVFGR